MIRLKKEYLIFLLILVIILGIGYKLHTFQKENYALDQKLAQFYTNMVDLKVKD